MKFRIMSDCQVRPGQLAKRGDVLDLSEKAQDDMKIMGLLSHAGRLGSMDPEVNPEFAKASRAPRAE